jgi:small-conductance mechanosensitive channel
MQDMLGVLDGIAIGAWIRAALILVVGVPLVRLLGGALYRLVRTAMGEPGALVLRRAVYYGLTVVVVMTALRELGFNLGVLLGAAGVLSVAIGFASQTSASNLVSGIFLVAERPFSVGDVITVGTTTGEVLSIDLLSVKLRTFDNLFVRVPNEALIKSEIINLTRFPIRRLDLQIGVAYKEDIGRVRDTLIQVADQYPLCLDQPRPLTIFQGFGDSALNLQFSIWAKRENYLALRNAMPEKVKKAFDAAGIEIPFPHRSLYAGSMTDPFPVRIVEPGATPAGGTADI